VRSQAACAIGLVIVLVLVLDEREQARTF